MKHLSVDNVLIAISGGYVIFILAGLVVLYSIVK